MCALVTGVQTCALPISGRRLAKQDHARVAVAVEKSSELFGRLGRGQRLRLGAEHFDQFGRRLARDAIIGERLCHELALWWKRAAAMSVRPWSSGRLTSRRANPVREIGRASRKARVW